MTDLTQAAQDVLAERSRQQVEEGFQPAQDDEYVSCQLARAAACYAYFAGVREEVRNEEKGLRDDMSRIGLYADDAPTTLTVLRETWPWAWAWWKPKDRRSDLVRAAALAAGRWLRSWFVQ